MRQELIDEFRRAVRDRDAARERRANLSAKLADLKAEIRAAGDEVAKLEKTVEAVQHEMLTGLSGLDLVDAATARAVSAAPANGHADERPGPRSATNFFGKRERGTK